MWNNNSTLPVASLYQKFKSTISRTRFLWHRIIQDLNHKSRFISYRHKKILLSGVFFITYKKCFTTRRNKPLLFKIQQDIELKKGNGVIVFVTTVYKPAHSSAMIQNCVTSFMDHSYKGSISSMCLSAAFTHADPKSAQKTVKSSSFLHFWDLCTSKLGVNTLMKLTTPCRNDND